MPLNIQARGRGELWQPSGTSLESRLEAIETNLSSIRDRMNAAELGLDEITDALQATTEAEKRRREQDIQDIQEKMAKAHLGGLGLAFMGLTWVAAGTTMGTIPQELLCLIRLI